MKALVTGGGGFLGGAIVDKLLEQGHQVRSFARGSYPELEERGVEVVRGDLSDADAISRAVAGMDAVFHVAAKAGIWGSYASYHRANVTGTENVLASCRAHGAGKLIYTSSPSVVFDGRDQEGVDESAPYPERYLAYYPRTKALAERKVLDSNDADLLTVALRPHLIWGPGDNHLVPRVIERARAGRLRNLGPPPSPDVDSVYVDNAAQAHILAEQRLQPGSPACGRAYFISQGEPVPMSDLINMILEAANEPPVERRMSAGAAYAAGAVFESVHRLLGLEREPVMTRFLARQLSTAHWFDISAARRDLGYNPDVSISDGMERLASWLRAQGMQGERS